MSNEVYGFAEFDEPSTEADFVAIDVQKSTGLGIVLISPSELLNFTESYIPSPQAMVFMVTDRPGSGNASYLIDFENYAPEAQIGLPTDGADRLQLLVAAIESIFTVHGANRICIAVTDSSEIDSVQRTFRQDLRDVLINDFREMAPPCRLYDIRAANT